jgi:hypothetical protein
MNFQISNLDNGFHPLLPGYFFLLTLLGFGGASSAVHSFNASWKKNGNYFFTNVKFPRQAPF